MKTLHSSVGVLALYLAATACSSEPIAVQPDKNEAYTREFIKEFGVPASNHNYAMAKHAGLKVTVHETTVIKVTAEVDGTEYLFGDLTLTPGEHALPVTIPSSVKNLTLTTSRGTMTVGVDDTVDLADITSENSEEKRPSGKGGYFDVEYENTTDYTFKWVETDQEMSPVLAFNPKELLADYMAKYPEGEDNIDYWFRANKTTGLVDYAGVNFPLFYSESLFASKYDKIKEYYFFPVYWRTNKDGDKNYETCLYEFFNYAQAPRAKFNTGIDNVANNIPFPDLGYSTTITDIADIKDPSSTSNRTITNLVSTWYHPNGAPDYVGWWQQQSIKQEIADISDVHNIEGFTFDNGGFEKAYDIENTTLAISRGFKVKLPPYDKNRGKNGMYAVPRFGMYVKYGNGEVSGSMPFYNAVAWNGRYFDESLNNIYFANSSAQSMDFGETQNEEKIWISDCHYDDKGTKSWKGNFHSDKEGAKTLIGFSRAPKTAADKETVRDFWDVIYLVVPVEGYDRAGAYAEPKAYDWIVAAEDLGGSYDWDFNDVVFSFNDILASLNTVNKNAPVAMASGPRGGQSVRMITVKPLAAGGTMPVYVTYTGRVMPAPVLPTEGSIMYSEAEEQLKDFIAANAAKEEEGSFILGTEMHKWLGSRGLSPINVGEEIGSASGQAISFVIPTEYSNDNFDEVDWSVNASGDNKHLYGFAVLVDKENKLNIDTRAANGYQQVPDLILGQDTYLIGAPDPAKGKVAPQLILMHPDWQWPQEETDIRLAYPTFVEWVSEPDYVDWHKSPVIEHVTRRK